MNTLLLPPVLGVMGMIAALVVYMLVMKYPDGQDKVKKIGDQIHNGALAFMKTEYKYLLIFIAVLVVLVWFALGIHSAIAVITGAACSSLAGFIGMYAATKANVRTATAASPVTFTEVRSISRILSTASIMPIASRGKPNC